MSQIVLMGRYGFLLFIVMLVTTGCGTPNDNAPFDADAGKHASDWVYAKHAAASRAAVDSCMECHGSDLAGGLSGVACGQCHLKGSPLTVTNCTSCHASPPNGTVAPNRSLSHPVHNAFPNVANVCDSCHSGAGTGTANHYNGAVEVVFLNAYSAKSGAAVRNADGTCSKVSCHGGQTTPLWVFGIIDVNTQCIACHAYGTAEYNSYSSGRHNSHVNTYVFACTKCHDTVKLAGGHFTSLNTSTMEGPAAATLASDINYIGGSCTPACHNTRSW
jgi:predicted CxxxxCH...CXXCH cytochrome family protein